MFFDFFLTFLFISGCGLFLKMMYMLRELQNTINKLPSQMDKNTDDIGLAISAVCLAVEDIQRTVRIQCQTLLIDLDTAEPGPQDLSDTESAVNHQKTTSNMSYTDHRLPHCRCFDIACTCIREKIAPVISTLWQKAKPRTLRGMA